MTMKKIKLFLILIFCFSLADCAKRGIPEGGPKDETPPFLINAEPAENSVNFNENRIRLYFNEYIKLKDFRKQLVVSPPIDKSFYSISPQSGASKFIQIDIKEKLENNTTYVFNFGESIVDNNEGNPLPFFNYVFSTGDYIDSLSISGNIKNSFKREPEEYISTFLYPIDENFSDSIIYNGLPNYVGSTLDSTNFKMTNLKKGKYLLVAIKDENSNYKFDPEFEKISFTSQPLNLPISDSLELKLFKETIPFKSFKPFIETTNRIGFGFKGVADDVKIKILNHQNIQSILTKNKETDTLNYWFKEFKYDSLNFELSTTNYKKNYTLKFKESDKDSLIITSSIKSTLELNEGFKVISNRPLVNVDPEKIKVFNKDSVSIPFDSYINDNQFDVSLNFEVLPNDNYIVNIMPNAITDFFESTNDSLSYSFKTKSRADYGTLKLGFRNIQEFPVIVHLMNNKEDIIREIILGSYEDPCLFENLKPGNYFVRVLFDTNKNGVWDTGNFLKKIQPEKTFHYSEEIVIRKNWVLEEKIDLTF